MASRSSLAVALLWSAMAAPLSAQTAQTAQTAQSRDAVLWLQPAPTGALLRVQGQLVDVQVPLTPVRLSTHRDAAAVEGLVDRRGARLALWVERADDGSLSLHVYEASAGMRPVRHFAVAAAAHGESAALEALALAVRSLLRSLQPQPPSSVAAPTPAATSGRHRPAVKQTAPRQSGGESGVTDSPPELGGSASAAGVATDPRDPPPAQTESQPESQPDPQSGSTPDRHSESQPEPQPEPTSPSPLQMALSAGWELRRDGLGSAHGPGIALEVGAGALAARAYYSGSLRADTPIDDATLGLRSDRWAVGLRLRLWRSHWQRVDVGGAIGLLLLHRGTDDTGADLRATPSATTPAATAELNVGLGQALWRWPAGALELTARVGGLWLATPIILRARTPRGLHEIQVRSFQPTGILALTWRYGRDE